MKLTTLGMYGAILPAGKGTSAYLVESGDKFIALDFGESALSRMQNFVLPENLSAIILSHLHYDHMCDILPLTYCLNVLKKDKLKIFMPFDGSKICDIIRSENAFDCVKIEENKTFFADNFSMQFCLMTHSAQSYGVKISDSKRTLFYSGDTTYNDKIISFASQVGAS